MSDNSQEGEAMGGRWRRKVEPAPVDDPAPATAGHGWRRKPWAWGAVAVGVIAVIVWPMMSGQGKKEDTAAEHRFGAESICRKAVAKQLKDPDSAKHTDVSTSVTQASGPVFGYRVEGTVRALNSFGGMAVMTYTCAATYDTDSGMAEGTAKLTNA